jgi:hypothetical protein
MERRGDNMPPRTVGSLHIFQPHLGTSAEAHGGGGGGDGGW